MLQDIPIKSQDQGRRVFGRNSSARVSRAAMLAALWLGGCSSLLAQVSCDPRWESSVHWRGTFTVTANGHGFNSGGTEVTVNNSLTASFERNNQLGTTSFTNDHGVVFEAMAASCSPAPGQLVQEQSGSGPLTNSTIDIAVDTSTCTYALLLDDNIMADSTFDQCGLSTVDLGLQPSSPSLSSFQINPSLHNLPLVPFGQFLTGQVVNASSADGVPITVTLNWKITPLDLLITNVQTPAVAASGHTFVSTDAITLTAVVTPAVAGKPVAWTVTGTGAASGVSGLPQKQTVATDANGVSTFVFTPNSIGSFVSSRQSRWTSGSQSPNPPIGFEVVASLSEESLSSALSSTRLGPLEQDEADTLRQEYVDIHQPVPTRAQVVASLGSPWNKGNYGRQLDNNLQSHFTAIQTSYRGLTVTNKGVSVKIPPDAVLVVNSAFRCPQLNKAIGSVHPESRHTRGSALDLKPLPVTVIVGGVAVSLDMHGTLYPALAQAVRAQNLFPLPERSAVPVPLGDPSENHIHVEW